MRSTATTVLPVSDVAETLAPLAAALSESFMWQKDNRASSRSDQMDISDVAVRHVVSIPALNVRHTFDFSHSTVSIAKEIRICVIATVIGLTTASIVRSVLMYKRSSR